MSPLIEAVKKEIATTLLRPWRIFNVLSLRRWRIFLGDFRTRATISNEWTDDDKAGTRQRSYGSYEEYLSHQLSSLGLIDLSDYDRAFRPALRDRLQKHAVGGRGSSVLCLAARIGTEVKAFRDLGCFAVGTDINNREKNPWVLYGDFHNLEFADESVDIVYTNSLDHVFDLGRVLHEVRRVLKPGGTFVLEIALGAKQGITPGPYEAFWWDSTDALAGVVEKIGFTQRLQDEFEVPWSGEMRIFARLAESAAGPTRTEATAPVSR